MTPAPCFTISSNLRPPEQVNYN